MAFKNLFNPIKIRGLELKNRVIFPAMGTKMATEEGYATDKLIDYHVARALGGNGLNIEEVCAVHGPSSPKKFLSLSDDKFIPKLKEMTDKIHEAGGKASVQLWQGGIAVASDPKAYIMVPSDMPFSKDYVVPAATIETIKEVIKSFGEAAKRAVEAGFDSIEFHAAHSYSPHSFLSPAFNRRTDEYGGSFENRARYSIECIKAIRENIPEDMPLFMRVDAHDDYLENGLTIEDIIEFCLLAKEAGVDVLDVSRGNMPTAAIKYEVPPVDVPRGFNVENAAIIKEATGMLTIAVGRINDPGQADEIINSGKADMVVIGRGQLADPEFCKKAYEGDVDSIIKCVACNQGCFDGFVSPNFPHITCMRNPALGREKEFILSKTEKPKTVVVAGGGLAGLEAAIVLKERGHNPILCEESNELGGQFLLAGVAPRKEEMREAAIARGKQAIKAGVDVRFSTKVTPELLKEISPEAVIIATGAEPIKINIPGADLKNVVSSHHVLAGRVNLKGKVVIIGGGLVGLEVAEYLGEDGNEITVVEKLDQVAKDLGQLRKICVMENLHALGIKTLTDVNCKEIKEDRVIIEKDGQTTEIMCDYVVMAVGARARKSVEIEEYCKEENISCYTIGDALRPRRALDAVAEAAEIAIRSIL